MVISPWPWKWHNEEIPLPDSMETTILPEEYVYLLRVKERPMYYTFVGPAWV